MNRFFKQLPLAIKLILIGFVPLALLIYLSIQFYTERTEKVSLLKSYIDRMHYSSDITMLIDRLQLERKYSYEYALKKVSQHELSDQRPRTDSSINRLSHYGESLADFGSYTFLGPLQDVRKAIDSGYLQPTIVMDYYTNIIFRLNTLNALPTGSDIYLQPVYKDLVAQKLLSEMITYLGIMSANIYNALYTRQYIPEILMGTRGVYDIYTSYEKEFLLKASSSAVGLFRKIKENEGPLRTTGRYIDSVFKRFSLDSTYNYTEWGKIYSAAMDDLRHLQQDLLQKAAQQVSVIYEKEQVKKRRTLLFFLGALVFVTGIIAYSTRAITQMLRELKISAERISLGAPGYPFTVMSNDAMGSLAKSISTIDKNHQLLADAAYSIGKGYFDVPVDPRSPEDQLGNAIINMKQSLQKSIAELAASNAELEKFAYVASHDLQEPLRMVRSFMELLEKKYSAQLDATGQQYIRFAVDGADRMKRLVQDLLQYSRIGTHKEGPALVDCNEVMVTIKRVFELTLYKTNGKIIVHSLPVIKGIKTQIEQVFQNLVGNALKYHRDIPPEVEIGYKENEKAWEFFVKDNGIGIEPRFYNKIFVIFQRLHQKNEYSGTGIGLAICKKIVERHGGKIWVESEPGKGSTFFFTISKTIAPVT